MNTGKQLAVAKMRAAGVGATAIAIFADYWDQLASGATGVIPEASIAPMATPDTITDLDSATPEDREALARTAIIKLNGGLGTSMGLDKAKSLLPVRDGLTFLDIIVRQVRWARQQYGIRLPLVFLHSFSTRADVLEALEAYPDLPVGDLPVDMMQSEEPKLLRSDLTPVEWPADPLLEWCPPGHGDLYPTVKDSGILDALIDAGFQYVSVSNSDNLGAAPSPALAGWFARTGAPFATEITSRTPMDVKGGHIAVRRSDGRLILRESAQTLPGEMKYFTDPAIHPYAHCNNLWFDLAALRTKLEDTGGVLRLPLIRNAKVVDPTDPASPAVFQIESAMGAAIESFEGARAIAVPRSRFLPVKTTNELTLLRSDVFELGEDSIPRATVSPLPVITLSSAYATISACEQRIPSPLSLRGAHTFRVDGDWSFGTIVRIIGDVHLTNEGGSIHDGSVLSD
ncbi:MAG: UTP--glucose-1-phosphate uridylyltransferase [Propionibacteriaceae bacterium]|nr:UTP--glucose-1-phosphate uridylyltransferase [Propionibacteriaceae bacterium]